MRTSAYRKRKAVLQSLWILATFIGCVAALIAFFSTYVQLNINQYADSELRVTGGLIICGAVEGAFLSGIQSILLLVAVNQRRAIRWFVSHTIGISVGMTIPMLLELAKPASGVDYIDSTVAACWVSSWLAAGLVGGLNVEGTKGKKLRHAAVNTGMYLCLSLSVPLMLIPLYSEPSLNNVISVWYVPSLLGIGIAIALSGYFSRETIRKTFNNNELA